MPPLRPTKSAPLLTFVLAVASAAVAAAQTAPAPAPTAPAQGAPSATPPRSPQTQSAIKLAGLVTFVANSCPKLQPNYGRFADALNALGVSKTDLDKPDLKAAYIGYAARYNTDVKANCERADAQFGPQGKTLEGIFAPR